MLFLLTAVLLLAAGCGQTKYEPAAINESVDKCEVCNMQIKDDAFATQIIEKNNKGHKFDDLGDLFAWKKKNGTEQIGAQYVRDYNSKKWIPLEDATFVYDKTIRTPMAYGVISFEQKKDAEAFIKKEGKGQLMTGKELDSHKWEMNKDMMNMHGADGHKDAGHGASPAASMTPQGTHK
ncbi:hypothetical protein J31TS4_37180 [Paenibacillus sp. J31TS4]|nr:hypothetical protein J31TS4_37180 [Paenibacillus sp. J31TS4]